MSGQGANEAYLAGRLADCAKRAARQRGLAFSHFLDPAQSLLAISAAKAQGVCLKLWGGYEDAERRIAVFYAMGEAEPRPEEWPLRWLRCRWDARYASPQHRDLLGALMGQGIERENLGDLLVLEGQAYCAALPDMAGYLAATLREAGRATLRCDVLEGEPEFPQPQLVPQRETVASLRLDAVLAAGWNLSRTEAAELIEQGKVRVNYLLEERTDARLAEGALVSVRGKGRFQLTEIGSLTKKGRIGIVLSHYR